MVRSIQGGTRRRAFGLRRTLGLLSGVAVLAAVEAARDKVMADEVKSLTKLGIPKAMAYQMIASRFHQKVGNQEEAEPDPFEGNATSWEEIG